MADIATVILRALYRQTSVAIPDWSTENWPTQTVNANKGEKKRLFAPNGALITRPLTQYVTVESLGVMNLHATTDMEMTWTDTHGHVNSQAIKPGRLLVVPDINPAINITFQGIGAVIPFIMYVLGT